MFTSITPPKTQTKSELIASLSHIPDDGLIFLKIPKQALQESLSASHAPDDLYFAVGEAIQPEPCGASLVGQIYLPLP